MITVREKVRFVETDMMGVVHHSNYFRWFEIARVEYLRQAGIDLLELMEDGILFPITEASCQYLSPARFGDAILIETELKEVSKVKMVFTYQVVKEADSALLSKAWTQNVFTSGGKAARLPGKYYDRLKASFERQHSEQEVFYK